MTIVESDLQKKLRLKRESIAKLQQEEEEEKKKKKQDEEDRALLAELEQLEIEVRAKSVSMLA